MVRFTELNPEAYRGAILIVDIDGTLTNDRNPEVEVAAKQQLRLLAEQATVYLCSNSSSTARFWQLARETGTVYLGTTLRKPDPRILELIPDVAGKRIVVIGDKHLTDGRFAKKIGAEFVQVSRITHASDRTSVRMTYAADDLYSGSRRFTQAVFPYIKLARPHQWVKNLLVFAPMFFANKVFDAHIFIASTLTFLAFSFIASTVYVLNDLVDAGQDRKHPNKRLRPIASGSVSKEKAIAFMGVLLSFATIAISFVPAVFSVALIYIALNMLYTFTLKHVAVVDILLVASFYLLRVDAGGAATGLPLSPWIILCVLFGSLFIVVGKRRGEAQRETQRAVLNSYSPTALDALLVASATLAIISYGLYSILGHNSPYLVYTTVPVVFAIFRMLNAIYAKPEDAESPEKLVFKDRWIAGAFAAWALLAFWIFYLA